MLSRLLTVREQLVIAGLASALLIGAAALYFVKGRGAAEVTRIVEADVAPAAAPMSAVETGVAPAPVIPAAEIAVRETEEAVEIAVAAKGAVHKPGLYHLPEGALVQDLIDAAGGALESANLEDINLAAPLINSTTLTVPTGPVREMRQGTLVLHGGEKAIELNPPRYTISGWHEAKPAPSSGSAVAGLATAPSSTGNTGKIDLNRADAATLEQLPGIGPKLAGEIIRTRDTQPFQTVDDLTNVSGIGPKRLEAVRDMVTVSGGR